MADLKVLRGGRSEAQTTERRELPAPTAPLEVARQFISEHYAANDAAALLRHWRGGWWRWHRSRWVEVEERAVKAEAYEYTEIADYITAGDKVKPWAPTRRKISDLLDALGAASHLSDKITQPSWIDGRYTDETIVACKNGLLEVRARQLLEHTPGYFNQTAVPFAYDSEAAWPERWLKFLGELWATDEESISTLQEWFGYVISGRTDLHKILLLTGPTRAGKGVISRTCGKLIGADNVAGPTLSSLAGDFGLAPLLGKQLAVISDARLGGRGHQVVVERLLSISGEDLLTINRKYREQWTGQLPTRFMVVSNELPQLGDASAAIANRFVPLQLERSWLHHEDRTLERNLDGELSGILNWALDGLARLDQQGEFTRPGGADQAITTLMDLASPVAAFVRDRCRTGADLSVIIDELYAAWKAWAEDNGHGRQNKQTFGRDLRAAVPRLRVERTRDGEDRQRRYVGIALRETGS